MPAPRKYPPELQERAMRLVQEARKEDPDLSVNQAVVRIGQRVGVNPDTLRGWVKQAQIELTQLQQERANAEKAATVQLEGLALERGSLDKEAAQARRLLDLSTTKSDRDGVLTWVLSQRVFPVRYEWSRVLLLTGWAVLVWLGGRLLPASLWWLPVKGLVWLAWLGLLWWTVLSEEEKGWTRKLFSRVMVRLRVKTPVPLTLPRGEGKAPGLHRSGLLHPHPHAVALDHQARRIDRLERARRDRLELVEHVVDACPAPVGGALEEPVRSVVGEHHPVFLHSPQHGPGVGAVAGDRKIPFEAEARAHRRHVLAVAVAGLVPRRP